jgi:plasmid stability protein
MRRASKAQYTIRSIPSALDRVLREKAKREGKSLNETILQALTRGVDLLEKEPVFTDLDHCIGTWQRDPAFDAAIAAQDTVDEEAWR